MGAVALSAGLVKFGQLLGELLEHFIRPGPVKADPRGAPGELVCAQERGEIDRQIGEG